jgi:hypothetical protein
MESVVDQWNSSDFSWLHSLSAGCFFARSQQRQGASANIVAEIPGRAAPEISAKERSFQAWVAAALKELSRDGTQPDSILSCTIQTGGDGDMVEYDDFYVGAFREPKFLRFVMRDWENRFDTDERHLLTSWDVPFSRIVAVILRERTAPGYPLKSPAPDGSWYWREPYYQTRVYIVDQGIQCRLLDSANPESDEPYRWLRANVHDPAIRFYQDSQDSPTYGDGAVGRDFMDQYANRLTDRSEAQQDLVDAARAAALQPAEVRELLKSGSTRIRDYVSSKEYDEHLYEWVRSPNARSPVPFAEQQITAAERIADLVLAGVIKRRYYAIAAYDYFANVSGSTSRESEKFRVELLGGVHRILYWRLASVLD